MSEQKLSDSIEAFLASKEVEPSPNATIHRLSPWPAIFLSALFLFPAAFMRSASPLWSNVLLFAGLAIAAFFIERRRVCRIVIDDGGIQCFGLTGRLILQLDRKQVHDVDLEEGDGKDYYVWSDGRRYRIPTMYDGFHQTVAVLENWAAENRPLLHSPRT